MNNSTQNKETLELKQLKDYREQQGFDLQTVADGMKVSKDFIHYIESGEFEKLGAPTFVRGHVTNYCKVLGLEPHLILTQIPVQILQHQQLKTSDAMGSSPLSHVRRQSNHFGRYAVGTALLGMLCMSFYFIWDKWSLPSGNQTNQNISLSQEDSQTDGEKNITYSSLIPQVSGPNYNKDSSTEITSDKETIQNKNSGAFEDDVVADETTIDNNSTTVDSSGEGQEANNVSPTAQALYTIVMEFEEQAWVSIKTLDGELIVQDLLGPGKTEFEVKEPVRFRIGNAQKTQLKINDGVVELAPLSNKDVADFKWPLEPSS